MPRFNRSRKRNAFRRRGKRSARRLSVSRVRRGVRNVRNRRARVSLARKRRVIPRRRSSRVSLSMLKKLMPAKNRQVFSYVGTWLNTPNTAGDDLVCNYFNPVSSTVSLDAISTLSVPVALQLSIYSQSPNSMGINTGAVENSYGWAPKFYVMDTVITTTLSNCANHPVMVDVYVCQARNDIPYLEGGNNPLYIMEEGFRQNRETIEDGSVGMTSNALTPYNSQRFVECFKIVSVKKHQLLPGRPKSFTLRKRKPVHWNMSRFYSMGVDSTIAGAVRTIALRQHTVFHVFKVTPPLGTTTANPTGVVQLNSKIMWYTETKHSWQRNLDNRSDVTVINMPDGLKLNANSTSNLGSVREPFDMDYKQETFF